MLSLEEIFPEVPLWEVDQHYRARLFYRGALPKDPGGKVIPEQVLREEGVREWITGLRRQGRYLRRRHPILHGGLACLREHRSLVLQAVT